MLGIVYGVVLVWRSERHSSAYDMARMANSYATNVAPLL